MYVTHLAQTDSSGMRRLRFAWAQAAGATAATKVLKARFRLAAAPSSPKIRLGLTQLEGVETDGALSTVPISGEDGVLTVLMDGGEFSVRFKDISSLGRGKFSMSTCHSFSSI